MNFNNLYHKFQQVLIIFVIDIDNKVVIEL